MLRSEEEEHNTLFTVKYRDIVDGTFLKQMEEQENPNEIIDRMIKKSKAL